MDWYQTLGLIVGALALFWGGWKTFKHVPREVGEALIAFSDMIADNKITPKEWQRFVKECRDITEVARKLMLDISWKTPALRKGPWAVSLFRLIYDIARMLRQWQDEKDAMPPPPKSLGKISGNALRQLLWGLGLTDIHLGSSEYELTSLEENQRFLDWYRDKTRYELDEYDCNVFCLVKHAAAAKWMKGKFVWGHIWAESMDEDYPFPCHGFDIIVDHNLKIYFSDELMVAAPADKFMEAYWVKSNLVEI